MSIRNSTVTIIWNCLDNSIILDINTLYNWRCFKIICVDRRQLVATIRMKPVHKISPTFSALWNGGSNFPRMSHKRSVIPWYSSRLGESWWWIRLNWTASLLFILNLSLFKMTSMNQNTFTLYHDHNMWSFPCKIPLVILVPPAPPIDRTGRPVFESTAIVGAIDETIRFSGSIKLISDG